MASFSKGDLVWVQADNPGSPPHAGVADADSKGGFTIVRVRGVPFLISNDRISKA